MTRAPRLVSRTAAAAALIVASLAACAGMGRGMPDPAVLTPPQPRSASRPALVGATIERPVAVELVVEVDEAGIPDLDTLRLSGSGAEANRTLITDWLRATVFEPAHRNGLPVRGTFRMAADATVAVKR